MINQFFCHPEFSAFCLLSGLFYEKNNRQLAALQLVAYLQGHPILYLYQIDQKQPAEIAIIIGKNLEYVENLIAEMEEGAEN